MILGIFSKKHFWKRSQIFKQKSEIWASEDLLFSKCNPKLSIESVPCLQLGLHVVSDANKYHRMSFEQTHVFKDIDSRLLMML